MIERRQKFAFLALVLAKSLSVEQAARRYDCRPRTQLATAKRFCRLADGRRLGMAINGGNGQR